MKTSDLPDGTSDFFIGRGLDRPNRFETAHEMSFSARRFWAAFLSSGNPMPSR